MRDLNGVSPAAFMLERCLGFVGIHQPYLRRCSRDLNSERGGLLSVQAGDRRFVGSPFDAARCKGQLTVKSDGKNDDN